MKLFFQFIINIFFLSNCFAQGNQVFSGGEIINFGIVDISVIGEDSWSSERSSQPGFFSSIEKAKYTGYSDQANIDGYIKKYGNTAFVFPVGSGSDLRTLEISNPAEITDTYATAWIVGDPSNNLDPTTPNGGQHSVLAVSGPIALVSKAGQWDWLVGESGNLGSGTTGSGAGLIITASIPDMTLFAEASELRMVGWNGSSWIDLSGKSTANGNKENSTIIGTMVPGISAIAIGKIESALPFKLKSFSATSTNCNTVLKWETSYENNAGIFIIEQSLDLANFQTIASLPASGSSNGNSYSKQVVQPFGLAYYRLKFKNINGSFTYSHSISVDNNCNEIGYMQVYPNPVLEGENINLSFKTSYLGKAEVMVFNNSGQRRKIESIQVRSGLNLISIDIKNLLKGTYYIKLVSSDGKQIGSGKQFIKN